MDPGFRFDPDSSSDEEDTAVGRPPPQSPWEFSAYLGSAEDELTRGKTTSVDSKISRALQERPPISHPDQEEIDEAEDEDKEDDSEEEGDGDVGEGEVEGDEEEVGEVVEEDEKEGEEEDDGDENGDITTSDDESDKKVMFSVLIPQLTLT